MSTRIVLDLDCLIAAHDARENTKAQRSAWEYLSELTAATMEGSAYLIPSAQWERTAYRSTADSCTCPGHTNGRYCWHREAAATLDLARENAAIDQAARFSQEYIDACYAEFEPVYVAGIAAVATPTRTAQPTVNYRAALASGLADCF